MSQKIGRHIEQLKAAGALDGMPDTSQITLFDGLF